MAQPIAGLAPVISSRLARRWPRTALKGVVSAAVIALLFLRIPPAQVLEAATSTGLGGYVAVAAGLLIFLLLGALRVHLTVGAFARVPFASVAWLYCRSVALGAFTPGQVGELFGLTYFLKRRGVDMVDSLAITAVDRVTTLATLVLLATVGLMRFAPTALSGPVMILVIVGVAGTLTLFIRPWRKQIRTLVEGFAPGALPFFEAFCRFFLSHPVRASSNVLLGLARWVCAAGMLLVIIEPQLPVSVDRTFVLLANATARLVTYVPISINGIGVLELSAVELFKLGHIPAQLTFAAFVVNRVVYYLFAAAMVLGLAWSKPMSGGGAAPGDESVGWRDRLRPVRLVARTRAVDSRRLDSVDVIFAFACCLAAVFAARRPFPDPDLGWHLAGGLWMLAAGQVPHQDPFGTQHAFWLCYSWLPELGYAAAYAIGGFLAVHLLEILTFVGVAVCTCAYVRRLSRTEIETDNGTARVVTRASEWLTVAVVLSVLLPVCSLRPHVLSWIFLGILLVLIDNPRPYALAVFGLTLVWVNTHVYWILVPLVLLLWAIAQPALALRARFLGVLAAVGSVAIALINPYGWRLFPGIDKMLFDQAVSNRLVFELAPLSVRHPSFPLYCGVLLGVMLCLKRVIVRVGWPRVLLFFLLAAAGAQALKSLPLFVVSAVPLLVRGVFPEVLARIPRLGFPRVAPAWLAATFLERPSTRLMLVALATLLLGVLVLRETREQPFLRTPQRELFTIADVLEHDPRLSAAATVNVLGDANYGGWLDLALWLAKPATAAQSRFRVAIDNRGLVAGEGRFDEYDRLRQMSGDWRAIMRAWNIDVAVLPRPAVMVDTLRAGDPNTQDPGWDVVHVGTAWTVLASPRVRGQQK